jgi:hypothetical protein
VGCTKGSVKRYLRALYANAEKNPMRRLVK